MTGRQPNQDQVDEDKVIDTAIDLSTLPALRTRLEDGAADRLAAAVDALGLQRHSDALVNTLQSSINADISARYFEA